MLAAPVRRQARCRFGRREFPASHAPIGVDQRTKLPVALRLRVHSRTSLRALQPSHEAEDTTSFVSAMRLLGPEYLFRSPALTNAPPRVATLAA